MIRALMLLFFIYQSELLVTNYIINGSFQSPNVGLGINDRLPVNNTDDVIPWTGSFDLQGINFRNVSFGYGQYVDLQLVVNGWIQQIVSLPYDGQYCLSFLQKARNINYDSYMMETWWNHVLIGTFSPTNQSVTNISYDLIGYTGNNVLLFKEVSPIQDSIGSYIDEIQLTLVEIINTTNSTNTTNATSQEIINVINSTNTTNATYQSSLINTSAMNINEVHSVQSITIQLWINISEQYQNIQLTSDLIFQNWMSILAQRIHIQIEEERQVDFGVFANDKTLFSMTVKPNKSYSAGIVEVYSQNIVFSDVTKEIKFIVLNNIVYFNKLDQGQIYNIQKSRSFAEVLSWTSRQVYKIISSSLSSYFVISLFNFWNILLMYNFVFIQSTPKFAREIYEIMMIIIYEKGSITALIANFVQISSEAIKLEEKLPQNLNKFKKEYSWLGNFGFSSKIITNNFEHFVTVLFLLLKIMLLKIILILIPQSFKEQFHLDFNFKQGVMIEIIGLSPFLLISAGASFMPSLLCYSQKFQKFAQFILFFICIIVLPTWFVQKINVINKNIKTKFKQSNNEKNRKDTQSNDFIQKLKKIEKQEEQIEKIKERAEIADTTYFLKQFYFNISIPILVLLENILAFLIVNAIFLVYKSRYLIKYGKKMSVKNYIFGIIITFIWVIHHLAFCIFFLISRSEVKYPQANTYFGFTIIFTVLVGGCVQLLRLFFEIILFIVSTIRKLLNFCCSSKNQIHQQYRKKSTVRQDKAIQSEKSIQKPCGQTSKIRIEYKNIFFKTKKEQKKEKKLNRGNKILQSIFVQDFASISNKTKN